MTASRSQDPAHHGAPCRLAATRCDGGYGLFAAADVPTGAVVLKLDGEVVEQPSQRSVQIGVGRHVDIPRAEQLGGDGGPDDRARDERAERYLWRFLNHSCAPNTALRGRALVSTRPIQAGEPVRFDYETSEWDMAAPFACRCGAPACRGTVRGFRHLDEADRRALAPRASAHVLTLASAG